MNFLSEIKNFIKTEVMGIEETKATETKSADKKPPVIECKTEAPEDKVVINNTAAQASNQNSEMSVTALKRTIANLPAKADLNKMIKDGLLQYITGLTDEELEKLSTQEKNTIIEVVKFAIEHNKGLDFAFPNAIHTESSIRDHAKNAYEAIRNGYVKNAQEFENEVGNIAEELGSDFVEQTESEQINTLKEIRIKQDEKVQAEIDALEHLPENERNAESRKINGRKKYVERSRFNDATVAIARNAGESIVGVTSAINNSILLLSSDDMQHGAKYILSTCSSNEERTQIADAANFEHQKRIIKAYKEIGDEPAAESVKGYTATYMEAKSSEAVFEYQADYKSDRDMYEAALEKQRNGEALTAEEQELLSVMKSEYYTATAQGIGEGALNNVNMSTNEKAEFINKWEADAKCYDDYKEVTQNVKKSVDEKPEYKEIKEQIQAQNKKKENASVTNSNTNNSPANTKNTYHRLNQAPHNSRPVTQTINRSSIKLATIPQEFKQHESEDVEVKSVSEAIQEYGHEAVVAILEDNSLAYLRPQLKGVIKSYDLNTLQEIALKCSDSSFVYICTLIGDENKDKLIDFREKTKGLCYSAKEQIENLRGENAIA